MIGNPPLAPLTMTVRWRRKKRTLAAGSFMRIVDLCPAARMVQQPLRSSRFVPRPHWTQPTQPNTLRMIDQRDSLLFAPSPCIQ